MAKITKKLELEELMYSNGDTAEWFEHNNDIYIVILNFLFTFNVFCVTVKYIKQ